MLTALVLLLTVALTVLVPVLVGREAGDGSDALTPPTAGECAAWMTSLR